MSRRGDREDLGVEELNVGAWGNPVEAWSRPGTDPPTGPPPPHSPPHGPPTGPPQRRDEEWSTTIGRGGDGPPPGDRARSWLQRHTNHVVAAIGAFALVVAVIAVSSGSGGDPAAAPTSPPTTVSPSTTQGRPVATAAPSTTGAPDANPGVVGTGDGADDDIDYRFAVTEVPDGYEPTGAELLEPDGEAILPGRPMLFAADGTSWQTGPWLLISSGHEFGPPVSFPFERPPMAFTIGALEAELGTGRNGVEVTTFELGERSVSIAALGLDPLTTAAVASQVALSTDGIAVSEAALPSGLRARSDIDITAWEWQWVPGTRTTVSYGDGRDGWISFYVRPRDTAPDVFLSAPYVLADLRYAVVGNGTGIAGTYTPSYGTEVDYVIWQLADREYVATGTGTSLDELIAAAGSVVQVGDPDWRSTLWDDLRTAARTCCEDTGDPGDLSSPAEVATASVDDRWQIQAWARDGSVQWDGRFRPDTDFLAFETAVGVPLLRVGTRPRWPGMPREFPAAAVALVDRSMLGSVLRLTTTGSEPATLEVALQPLDSDGLAPYLAGSVVLPWVDGGFVAQLIAPDGQTIAIQTDADLP